MTRAEGRGIRRRVVAVAAIAVVLVAATPTASSALWRATATAPAVAVSAGVVTAPSQPTCSNLDEGVLVRTRSAVVTWPAVAGASSYVVTVRNASGSTSATQSVTDRTVKITTGYLTGLLDSLLQLLLGGDPLLVTVQTVHPSGWRSVASPQVRVGSSLIPTGVQCLTP